jgi:hypothetical protein
MRLKLWTEEWFSIVPARGVLPVVPKSKGLRVWRMVAQANSRNGVRGEPERLQIVEPDLRGVAVGAWPNLHSQMAEVAVFPECGELWVDVKEHY